MKDIVMGVHKILIGLRFRSQRCQESVFSKCLRKWMCTQKEENVVNIMKTVVDSTSLFSSPHPISTLISTMNKGLSIHEFLYHMMTEYSFPGLGR